MAARGAIVSAAAALACLATCRPRAHRGMTPELRRERLAAIRDVAAQMGVTNGALLAGIAISETNLAHCFSEATTACPGPSSSACDDGPVTAGAADGPCSAMQGGLGMFQFDAGTYAQTLAADGSGILTVDGNIAAAVNFVVGKVISDVPGVTDWASAVAWINAVPLVAGNKVTERWAALLACRYNGCCAQSTTCTARGDGYRDNAIAAYASQGAAFWDVGARCVGVPADGVIDERSGCYVAAGDPQYWRRDDSGYGDGLEWTLATNGITPANYAQWIIKTGRAGTFAVDVYLSGTVAQSKLATYQVVHAGMTDDILVDQRAAAGSGHAGWKSLGRFRFTGGGDGDEYVMLGDNTGEATSAQLGIVFDAVRVTAIEPKSR